MTLKGLFTLCLLMLFVCGADAMSSANYTLSAGSMHGGGGGASASANYKTFTDAIGQAVIGGSSSLNNGLISGIVPSVIPFSIYPIADFDGDGTTDYTVFRPSEGMWYLVKSSDSQTSQTQWGASSDVVVPGDYDGDGKTDLAVYRPSEGVWYIKKSSDGTTAQQQWGASTDIPLKAGY